MVIHSISKEDEIIIIGAGCIGSSTAFYLLERGFTKITILEKSLSLPPPNTASNDINRIIRGSYSNPFYTKLYKEAHKLWKNKDEWGDAYHESGVLILGTDKDPYLMDALHNDFSFGTRVTSILNAEEIRSEFSKEIPTSSFEGMSGYLNKDAGWANAEQGLSTMISKIKDRCKIVLGKSMCKILKDEHVRKRIVLCADGTWYNADVVIIATGAWTSSLFPSVMSETTCGRPTAQTSATLQLTEEEALQYKKCPVILDLLSGFYIFPPNEQNIVKMAMHLTGYNVDEDIDVLLSRKIPIEDLIKMRKHLGAIYPDLGKKSFTDTRLCCYNDTPDENWIIGRHPDDPSVVFATGDSGHLYKFLPIFGRLVVDFLVGEWDKEIAALFAIGRKCDSDSRCLARKGSPSALPLDELCTPEDLLSTDTN